MANNNRMFTPERIGLAALALAIIVFCCISLATKCTRTKAPMEEDPSASFQLNSVVSVRIDTVKADSAPATAEKPAARRDKPKKDTQKRQRINTRSSREPVHPFSRNHLDEEAATQAEN